MTSKRAIERYSLPDVIANDIRERILNGDLHEGEIIRQEMLAKEYNVSRMPVREALKRLDAEGLIQLSSNRGSSVTKHSLREIGEIFELRILIETDLFRRSIPVMKESDFSRCEVILKEMEASYDADDVGRWGDLNYKYHSALYAAADRRLTNELLHGISLHSNRYVRMHLSVIKQRDVAKKEHRDLLQRAQVGDLEGGCQILADHIRHTKDELLHLVAENRAREMSQ